jgi:hypothetical protein
MSLLFGHLEDEPLPSDKPKIDWSQLITVEDKDRQAEEAQRATGNTEARAYLAETDWYVIRLQETGQPVPDDVLKSRAEARASVIDNPPQ